MNDILGNTQWFGKKVAFLGDSITDKVHVGTTKNYWEFLKDFMGIEYFVYGINGDQWNGVPAQAMKLKEEHPEDMDAIFIFIGTNDFNGNVPLGQWWNMTTEMVNKDGVNRILPRRILSTDKNTVRGRINVAMQYIRENFPVQQIVLMTPLHRGFAEFSPSNVQPEETFANTIGLFDEEYVEVIRQAADIWATSLIDLFRLANIHPLTSSHAQFLHDQQTDLLHPNAAGHYRIAKAMAYQMLSLPADFR